MKRSRLLLISIIFILIALFASMPLFNQFAYGAQNLSADSISDLNGYYVNGGSSYDALSDGDICFVFKAGSDREFVLYIYDEDSGQTEDSDMYIKPDYYSSGRSYTGTGRWVKMSFNADNVSIYGNAVFEGSTIDAYETTFSITDPNADRTITVPNSDETIGIATSIQDDLITKADFADEDWGDVSVDSNSVTLDNDVIDPNHMADADHGVFSYSGGVASFDTNVVDADALAPDSVDISTHTNLTGTSPISISGDSIIIADAAADDSTKGAATFEADDFDSANGKIDLADSVCKSASSDSGTATPSTHSLIIAGGTGISTSATGSTVTITNDLGDSIGSTEIETGAVGDDEVDYTAVTLDDFDFQTPYRTFYSDANGDVQELAHGADGKALVSNGASADPDWEYLPRVNLLNGGNTQWIACSSADTAKGLGEVEYDNPNSISPSVGEVFTGGTSGATGVLIESDSNTLILGRCAGRFHDNERIRGGTSGFGADINLPNSAAGVDLIQNGEYADPNDDPPPGWTAVTATLTTDAGGQVTNMMTVASDGDNLGKAYQNITTVIGKIYYFDGYFKKGTADDGKIMIGITTDEDSIWDSGALTDAAWAQKTRYFKATATTTRITLQTTDATDGETSLFDEIAVYEVTPGCTGVNNLAFDGWYKDTTLDVYRQHNDGGTLTHDGSFYSGKFVPSATDDFYYFPNATRRVLPEWTQQFAGRTLTAAAGCLTSTASHAFIQMIDSDTTDYDQSSDASSYHTGDGTWQWLTVTTTVSASTTEFSVAFVFDQSAGVTYFTKPMLSFGSSIGAWNYVPEADKRIYFENDIASQSFNNKIGANGFSDVAATELCLESDSLACIGKSVKAVRAYITCNDVGSVATDTWFVAASDRSEVGTEFIVSLHGKANDTYQREVGWIPCNQSGNYEYQIEASGANTFDTKFFNYIGIEWR